MNRSRVSTWTLVVVAALSCVSECPAAFSGEGDELDQRIDNAIVGIRRDGGPASRNPVVRLDHYAPAPVATYAQRRSSWEYSLTPFFWVPATFGDIEVDGQELEVDSSIGDTFSDVIDNFNFAAMGRFEAHHCRWSFIFDLMYVGVGNEEDLQVAAAQIDAEWDFNMIIADAFVGYRFAELPLGCGSRCFRPSVSFDALAGARYYHWDLEIDLEPGPNFDGGKDLIDPVVGLRALFHVTPDLTFNLFGNIGGFGVGTELSWQIIAGIDYRVSRCVSLNAGWIILDIETDSGSDSADLTLSGPYIGATFRF